MENPDEVSKQCLPDTKFEFMEEVNDHHSGDVELPSIQLEAFTEGILKFSQTVDQLLTVLSLTIVGTEDISLRRLLTHAPATVRPTW